MHMTSFYYLTINLALIYAILNHSMFLLLVLQPGHITLLKTMGLLLLVLQRDGLLIYGDVLSAWVDFALGKCCCCCWGRGRGLGNWDWLLSRLSFVFLWFLSWVGLGVFVESRPYYWLYRRYLGRKGQSSCCSRPI